MHYSSGKRCLHSIKYSSKTFQNLLLSYIQELAWSALFPKTFENMRKLDYFRLPGPRCTSTATGAGSLKKSNFLMFSKVLRKAPDQSIYMGLPQFPIWTLYTYLHKKFSSIFYQSQCLYTSKTCRSMHRQISVLEY